MKKEIETCHCIGMLTGGKWDKRHEANRRVYDPQYISPTITTCGGGGQEVKVLLKNDCEQDGIKYRGCALRSRRYAGREQELELGTEEISNSITSVQKDALVEVKPLLVGGLVEEKTFGTQYHQQERVYSTGAIAMAHPAQISGNSYTYATKECDGIRIRKLTPKECFRLMNFSDADHEVSATVNSESQRYKQAGNSIVVSVLMGLFSQMGIGKKPWNEMTEQERQELVFPDGYITKRQAKKYM